MYNWRELDTLADTVDEAEFQAAVAGIKCHDVVNIQYTSGTTGFPKGGCSRTIIYSITECL